MESINRCILKNTILDMIAPLMITRFSMLMAMAVIRFLIPIIKVLCGCFSNGAIPEHQEGIAYSALCIVAFDLAEEKFHFVSLPNIVDPRFLLYKLKDACI